MRRIAVVSMVILATVFGLNPAGAAPLSAGWHVTVTDPTTAPLYAVSCVSERYCLGLGQNSRGEVWDGAVWTPTPGAPVAFDVSCTAERDCMVAGAAFAGGGRDGWETPMIAHWDGNSYTTLPVPIDPSTMGWASSVSCPASDSCMAAAGSVVLSWDGTTWTQTPVPATPAGAIWVYDLACAEQHHCVAVGVDPAGNPAVAVSDGSVWAAAPAPAFAPLQVACVDAHWCMAIGSSTYHVQGPGFGDTDSAATWDGSAWTPVAIPNAGWQNYFNVLSCGTRDSCAIVVGNLREHWDGRAWTITPGPGVAVDHGLYAVDCPDATTCLAVGYEQLPAITISSYAERWRASTATG